MTNDNEFLIPEPETTLPETTGGHFPVVAQLTVLGLVLAGLLGFTFIPQLLRPESPVATLPVPTAPLVIAESSITTIASLGDQSIGATSAYVYDVRAKRALYSKNADAVVPLASITKLMTALVARELITEDKTITVSQAAATQESASGLAAGERLKSGALTDFAVLASSNDAAFALAAAVGTLIDDTNPNQSFVSAMNLRAVELGLPNLKFYNPTGLDISKDKAGAVGTAREVSFLMEYILENYPSILEPTTFTQTRIYNEAGDFHQAENTNPVISRIPNLLGSKTGYTDLSGGNLTIAFDAGYNRPIIITVLGSSFDGRFDDTMKLVTAVTAAISQAE